MTLQELIASGKKGRLVGSSSAFRNYRGVSSFTLAEVQGTYEVEASPRISITLEELAAAWDAARPTSGSVATAALSPMYARMAEQLEDDYT